MRAGLAEVLVQDDHSSDDTFTVATEYLRKPAPTCRSPSSATPRTSATAATRRPATRYAINHGWDVVVLLHGDGQYAPEVMARPRRTDRRRPTPTRCSARG